MWRNEFQQLVSGIVMLLMGITIVSFMGCEQSVPPPPPPQPKIQKKEPPPPEQKAKAEEEETEEEEPKFTYDPMGRREPFKTLIKEEIPEAKDVVVIPALEIIETPLQKFPLDQIKVTGIILGGLGDYARVIAPDGKSYTVKVGTPMGNQEGKVISISENAVTVKETIRYESGKVEEVETPLYLNPIDEEEK